jgi:hypothetical protein
MSALHWQLTLLDALPPAQDLGSLAVGDLDGDGHTEIIVAGSCVLLWYRPATFERGVIDQGLVFQVGVAVADIDGDGRLEVVIGDCNPATSIFWYKAGQTLDEPWERHALDTATTGSPHDLLVLDLDGDGELEVVANAIDAGPGLFAYKRGPDLRQPWRKYTLQTGYFEEGLAAGDLNADGRVEIVSGPHLYLPPSGRPYSGPWQQVDLAQSFREMCRVALVDITGNGRPDVVIVESEYVDGRLAWFENRLLEDPSRPWREHRLEDRLVFAHSLAGYRDAQDDGQAVHLFLAEMAQGGFRAPYNWNARLQRFISDDGGATWRQERIATGAGTHEAALYDIDGDGEPEVVGKECWRPKVQIWKQVRSSAPFEALRHQLLDRDKPYPAVDILVADVNQSGRLDIVCGAWWYENPTWRRHTIPGVYQIIAAADLDRDGRIELIAIEAPAEQPARWYEGLSSRLCWLRPIDPAAGRWERHPLGVGHGDWPHGATIAPVGPNGQHGLLLSYHSGETYRHWPELFTVPAQPDQSPWPKKVLAEVPVSEELFPVDLTGAGRCDVLAGPYWLENLGEGRFRTQRLAEGFAVARVRAVDINGDGRLDVVVCEEQLDFEKKVAPFARLAWLEQPADPRAGPWTVHGIDKLRSPHSLDVADLDGDGQAEIICAEHDPFWPYRNRSRLIVYQKAEPLGRAWRPYVIDDRFEHHNGAKVFEMAPGRLGIVSHGWIDSRYVHLWSL